MYVKSASSSHRAGARLTKARFKVKAVAMQSGLEGVVVAETRLSEVDGEGGRLVICGHDVEELAQRCDFESL